MNNLPEFYLIEPYNAYAPKKKKQKHWHEVVEEQALLQKMIADHIALQEAQKSITNPPDSPSVAAPEVVAVPPAGGGGSPSSVAFNPSNVVVSFSLSPSNGAAPLTVQFSNTTPNIELYTYLWNFGDGTTSTDVTPSHVYDTSSGATNIFTASLTATSIMLNTVAGTTYTSNVSASIPVITPDYRVYSPANQFTGSASANLPFYNISTMNNGLVASDLTSFWIFGSGSSAANYYTSSETNLSFSFVDTGTYSVTLQVTGSYTIADKIVKSILII